MKSKFILRLNFVGLNEEIYFNIEYIFAPNNQLLMFHQTKLLNIHWIKKFYAEIIYNIRVYPWEIASSIVRPRPNPLKLSRFVELFALIIMVIKFLGLDLVFAKIRVKYYSHFFAFCKK